MPFGGSGTEREVVDAAWAPALAAGRRAANK
jgi:hypothetical protein